MEKNTNTFLEDFLKMLELNKIYNLDCREGFKQLDDNSIHLIVFSPPYTVGKEYEQNLTLNEWFKLMKAVGKESMRVLMSGGRLAINVANINRKPYIPLHKQIMDIALGYGFLMRGEIIWLKGPSAGQSTAWGSYKSASNPCLRDEHEYILVFSKDSYKLEPKGIDTITKSNFVTYSRAIWEFPTVSATRIGHPTPFPLELPRRLIEFYSFKENIVLDPFMGSGTTAIAALKTERRFIGFEINENYVRLANKRIRPYLGQKKISAYLTEEARNV
jgi:site-specific DNA-methyltransferase (adenine-specific)